MRLTSNSIEQHLMWLPAGENTGAFVPKVPLLDWPWPGRKPFRIWSLLSDKKPDLPFEPRHNVNAFLEDSGHDYQLLNNLTKLHWCAHSSSQEEPQWILVEFKGNS